MSMTISPNGPLSHSNYANSDMGLPETENHDQLLLAELTRRMAEFTFEDEDENYEVSRMSKKAQVRKEWFGRRVKTGEHLHRRSNMQMQMQMQMQDRRKAWKSTSSSPDLPLPGCGSGGSNGTGVFLPSAIYSKPDPKKKPAAGCSTVIIPARVLQTLQQHFNNVGANAKSHSQNSNSGSYINHHWQNDVLARINGLLSQQQEQAVFQIHPPAEELRLPHEWTY